MHGSDEVIGEILGELDACLRAVEETERGLMAAAAVRGPCDADLVREALSQYHREARRCFANFGRSLSPLIM